MLCYKIGRYQVLFCLLLYQNKNNQTQCHYVNVLLQSEHRTLAAYVLAGIVDNYHAGQEAALQV